MGDKDEATNRIAAKTSQKLAGLEGARPKNAVCLKCGYLFGGIAIEGGVVTCSECGEKNRFELPEVRRKQWPARIRRMMAALGWSALALYVIAAARSGGVRWTLVVLLVALSVIWMTKRFVRWWINR